MRRAALLSPFSTQRRGESRHLRCVSQQQSGTCPEYPAPACDPTHPWPTGASSTQHSNPSPSSDDGHTAGFPLHITHINRGHSLAYAISSGRELLSLQSRCVAGFINTPYHGRATPLRDTFPTASLAEDNRDPHLHIGAISGVIACQQATLLAFFALLQLPVPSCAASTVGRTAQNLRRPAGN